MSGSEKIVIHPGYIKGNLYAPPSKSISIRAAALAAMGSKPCVLSNYSESRDAMTALKIIEGFGSEIQRNIREGSYKITPGFSIKENKFNCGESGLCARIFPFLAALFNSSVRFKLEGSLKSRPMKPVQTLLKKFGAKCEFINKDGDFFIEVKGPIGHTTAKIDASVTSQAVSGLLIALQSIEGESIIDIENLTSSSYLSLTIDVLKKFGIVIDKKENRIVVNGGQQPENKEFTIEGDWSGAANFLCAGALSGEITLNGLELPSIQGDSEIIEILSNIGADVKTGRDTAIIKKGELKSFEVDIKNYPDLAIPLTALAFSCAGVSKIRGCGNLRLKESDRINVLVTEFQKLGGKISEDRDVIIVEESKLRGGEADPQGDHRIAMALTIAALNSKSAVRIEGHNCVNKSYPGFYDDLKSAFVRK